ncbi:MAG TPA: hypothetical protein VLA03_08960, partial [Draconibacterium sp.]|nr:hypothetical protein [Draconibacterium sp.]
TPYHLPHLTTLAGLKTTRCGDDRYFNNIFVGGENESQQIKSGLAVYEKAELPMHVDGNVYLNGARKFSKEKNQLVIKNNPHINIIDKEDGIYLEMNFDGEILKIENKMVTTELLGKTVVPDAAFENRDTSPLTIDYDYSGKKRNKQNPTAGPFENPGEGKIILKVWEKL